MDLEKRFARMYLIRDAATLLEWDASTFMPDGGAQARADQMATLRVIRHELLTDAAMGERLASAEACADLDEWERANLREMRREWIHATAVPAALVEARSQAVSACEMRWRTARRANDFAGLRPLLEEVVRLTREMAAAKSQSLGVSPYDALLDEWEPGGRAADIDRVFGAIESFLPSLVERVLAHQARRPAPDAPRGPFAADRQLELAHRLMRAMGFDFAHGRLDVSAHPFCAGIPEDVRITTRWDESDLENGLFSVIHETGHALYERGLPERWRRQPVGQARGMSTHESQSLLWEMQVARSPELVSWLAPLAREIFGGEGPAWDAEAMLGRVLRVERSLIRVDADEVTYPLHVILRYRLERALIAGDLTIADLPGAFDDGMHELLGVRPPNVCDGALQDIHWPAGMFGYFPTYTLGALTAAQLYAAALEANPSIPASLARGDAKPLTSWLVPNVHALGALPSAPEILVRATGRPLDPEVFRRHLERRYLG
ncbi:MAG: carboxypeptidase M32 [Deltaproteobacteria bacterium]|nr:carboxypeptidase M32 [Deltaproteobacteria bacterium]